MYNLCKKTPKARHVLHWLYTELDNVCTYIVSQTTNKGAFTC